MRTFTKEEINLLFVNGANDICNCHARQTAEGHKCAVSLHRLRDVKFVGVCEWDSAVIVTVFRDMEAKRFLCLFERHTDFDALIKHEVWAAGDQSLPEPT
jgi:hypothetical protein